MVGFLDTPPTPHLLLKNSMLVLLIFFQSLDTPSAFLLSETSHHFPLGNIFYFSGMLANLTSFLVLREKETLLN